MTEAQRLAKFMAVEGELHRSQGRETLAGYFGQAAAHLRRLEAECEQLRADAARLDWIEKGGQWVFTRLRTSTAPDAPRYWCIEDWDGDDLTEDVDEVDRQTLRTAIDEAMKETK